jgi:hypothetical protein
MTALSCLLGIECSIRFRFFCIVFISNDGKDVVSDLPWLCVVVGNGVWWC